MTDDLRRAFARLTQVSWDRGWIPGRLGRLNSDGSYTIPVSGKTGWVHVRLGPNGDRGTTIARNDGVPHHRNMPIRMRRENKILVVHGRDKNSGFTAGGGGSDVGPHATTHDRLGPDPLYIRGLAFLPLAARPTSPPSMAVTVERAFYRYDGAEEVWETGDSSSLSAYVPDALQQHFVVISLNRSTGALVITDGTDAASATSAPPFTPSEVHAIVDTLSVAHYPIAAVRLYNGQTEIRSADIFMDLRLWGGEHLGATGLDINGLTEDTDPDGAADYLATYDASASANKKVLLDNLPGGTGNASLLFTQTVDKTIADTTTETSLLSAGRGSKTLPADLLEQGTTIRLQLVGHISDTGNPTIDIKVTLGGTEVCSTGAQNINTSVTEVDWRADVLITCRATGASGSVTAGGLFEHDDGTHFGLVKTSETTIDTTGELEIDVTVTWGTADAADTITCQHATIEKLAVDALAPVGPTGLTATETA